MVAANALAFSARVGNEPECKLHLRRIQLGSDELASRLGLAFVPAWRGPVREVVTATAEVAYDQTRVARVTSRASGTVLRVEKQLGDKVQKGDLLAVVDSAEVGRAKAEFQQALVQLDLRRETLAKLRPMAGATVAEKDVQAVEAAAEEAEVRLVAAEELLSTLGLPIQAAEVRALSAAQLAERLRSGAPIREHERRFIAGALAIMSVLHLTADHRAGGRGKAMADAYERAAEELAALWNPPRTEAPAPGPRPTLPRLAPPRFVVGQRVNEIATGRTWWVDELDRQRPDLVGVIPDEGAAVVVWRRAMEFCAPGPDR